MKSFGSKIKIKIFFIKKLGAIVENGNTLIIFELKISKFHEKC